MGKEHCLTRAFVLQGKFAQRSNLSQHLYVTEVQEYVQLMTSEDLLIQDLKAVNEEGSMLLVQFVKKPEFADPSPNTNVVLASFVTAQARLKLYGYLDQLGERVTYCDTDSCLYTQTAEQTGLPLGDHLGDLTDETPGDPIIEAVFSGPKNYALNHRSGASCCKIRGFTLNARTSRVINFGLMRELMLSEDRFERRVETEDPHGLVKKGAAAPIFTKPVPKRYGFVFDKRRIVDRFNTLPFGYHTPPC